MLENFIQKKFPYLAEIIFKEKMKLITAFSALILSTLATIISLVSLATCINQYLLRAGVEPTKTVFTLPNNLWPSSKIIFVSGLVFLVSQLLTETLRTTAIFFSKKACEKIKSRIRNDLIQLALTRDRKYFNTSEKIDSFFNAIKQTDNLDLPFIHGFKALFRDLPFVFLLLLVIVLCSASLAFSFGACLICVFFLRKLHSRQHLNGIENGMSTASATEKELRHCLSNAQKIKEVSRQHSLGNLADQFYRSKIFLLKSLSKREYFTASSKIFLRFAYFLFGAHAVFNNQLALGDFILFAICAECLFSSLMNVAEFIGTYPLCAHTLNATQECHRKLALIPTDDFYKDNGGILPDGELIFRNSTLYSNNTKILDEFSLCIPTNQAIAVVGLDDKKFKSFAHFIMGHIAPQGGELFFETIAPINLDRNVADKEIRILPKEPILFSGSIRDNLDIFSANKHSDLELYSALEFVAAKDWVLSYPQRLETIIGAGGLDLTQDQKAQIALARIFLDQGSKIFFLNEPIDTLPPQIANKIITSFHHLAKRTLYVFWTTNRVDELKSYALFFERDKKPSYSRSEDFFKYNPGWRHHEARAIVEAEASLTDHSDELQLPVKPIIAGSIWDHP